MIKKDVINETSIEEQKSIEQKDNVDDIFAEADRVIAAQNKKTTLAFKEKPKKPHRVRKFIISFLLITIAAIVILGLFVVDSMKAYFPTMKMNFLTQMTDVQAQLKDLDDSELTIEQYYQKRILLLFTAEDIDNAIDSLTDIDSFTKLLELNEKHDMSLLPPDKVEEYNKLIEEYEQAMKNPDSHKIPKPEDTTADTTTENTEESTDSETTKQD